MADAGPWDAKSTGEIAFTVTTTLADHLAFQRYYHSLPFFKNAWQTMIMIAVAAAPVAGVVICLLVAWGLTGTPCALDEDLGTSGKAWLFGKVTGGLLLAEGLALAVYFLAWRRIIENRVRANLAIIPHIKPDDEEMRERKHIRMDEVSYTCETPHWSFGYSWEISQCFGETDDHLFVMADARRGLVFPKREMHDSTIVAVRELMARKLSTTPRAAQPGPGLRI